MQIEQRRKIEIIIAIIIVIALIGVLWFFLWRTGQPVSQDIASPSEQETPTTSQELLNYDDYEEDASTVARVFVERFGSFSNQSDYENISSVMDLTSDSLQLHLEGLMQDAQDDSSSVYYGISTYVLSISQIEVSDEHEVLEVLTQREESIDSPSNTSVKYQTIQVEMIKNGDDWIVNDFEWSD